MKTFNLKPAWLYLEAGPKWPLLPFKGWEWDLNSVRPILSHLLL